MTRADGSSVRKVTIGDVEVDNITFWDAVEEILALSLSGSGGYICTPNVDHIVRARRDPTFLAAVLDASMRVPDGMGIVYGSRILGQPLASTVTGRLLPIALARRSSGGRPRVALFGGPPGTAEAAGERLREEGAHVVAAFAPSMAFGLDSDEDEAAVDRLAKSRPELLWVGLGAPKQELWMHRHRSDLPGTVMVGVGAAIPVLAGWSSEAPRWMTRIGMEWLFRLAHEPRRLSRRYLWDDPRFFWWMVRERLKARGSTNP